MKEFHFLKHAQAELELSGGVLLDLGGVYGVCDAGHAAEMRDGATAYIKSLAPHYDETQKWRVEIHEGGKLLDGAEMWATIWERHGDEKFPVAYCDDDHARLFQKSREILEALIELTDHVEKNDTSERGKMLVQRARLTMEWR